MLKVDAVFVLHVKQGSEERAVFMENQLSEMGIKFEYMLDGDIPDLSEYRKNKYFDMNRPLSPSEMSCAMKHILIYEQMISRGLERVLIFEDDAILKKNFVKFFNASTLESV